MRQALETVLCKGRAWAQVSRLSFPAQPSLHAVLQGETTALQIVASDCFLDLELAHSLQQGKCAVCRETVVGEDNLYPLEPPHWLCLTLCVPEEAGTAQTVSPWEQDSKAVTAAFSCQKRPAWHFLQIKGQLEHSLASQPCGPCQNVAILHVI